MECFGALCSAIVRDYGAASLLGNSVMTFWSLSCGFLVNPATFPFYLNWISFTAPLQYAFAGLIDNQFDNVQYPCPAPPGSPICAQFSGKPIPHYPNVSHPLYRGLRHRQLELADPRQTHQSGHSRGHGTLLPPSSVPHPSYLQKAAKVSQAGDEAAGLEG